MDYSRITIKNIMNYNGDVPSIVIVLNEIAKYLDEFCKEINNVILREETLHVLMNSLNFHPRYMSYFKHLAFEPDDIYLETLSGFQLTWIKYFPDYKWDFGKFGVSRSVNFELPWIKYYQKHGLIDKLDINKLSKSKYADKSWVTEYPDIFKGREDLFEKDEDSFKKDRYLSNKYEYYKKNKCTKQIKLTLFIYYKKNEIPILDKSIKSKICKQGLLHKYSVFGKFLGYWTRGYYQEYYKFINSDIHIFNTLDNSHYKYLNDECYQSYVSEPEEINFERKFRCIQYSFNDSGNYDSYLKKKEEEKKNGRLKLLPD